jgi:selenocysteine-specific elongation factor
VIVGTAGHIDHGKTSLVRALTGVDTDRLKEEKARGISIDLGFAYMPMPDGAVLGFVDVPGHERFIHNMLAGATGIDAVLLVVAADDGVMPQTVEHLAIINLLGVTHGIVAVTKADLATDDRLIDISFEVENLLAGTALAGSAIHYVSTVTGQGVDGLRQALFDAASALGQRAAAGRFRLAVDRSFTLAGTGTVVTGTVLSGAVSVGDRVIVSPSGLEARVRGIHAQNRPAGQGQAGDRCALNLAGDGMSKDAVARGDVVVDPEVHAPADRIDATLQVLAAESKPVRQWTPVRLHHAAAEVGARVVLLGETPIQPGTEALVQLVLDRPIAAAAGDRFVIRDTSAQRTVGGGRLLDLRAPARRRRTPERIAQLQAHSIREPEHALAALLDCAPGYADLAVFSRDRAQSAVERDAMAERLGLIKIASPQALLVLSRANWQQLKRSLLAALETFHKENPDLPGAGMERLRMRLEPRLPAPAFAAVLQGLARHGEVSLDGAWVRLPGHEVRLTPQDERIWGKMLPLISGSERFRPPRVRDIAGKLDQSEPDIRRIMKLIGRIGKVDEVAPDHFFLRATISEIVEIIVDLATQSANGEFTAAQLRDRLDNGRKVAIQILEFFDRHGATLRRGDLRRVNKQRLDLFRMSGHAANKAGSDSGRESSLVGRPDFKSGWGRETVLGGFDSHSLPPRNGRSSSSLARRRLR